MDGVVEIITGRERRRRWSVQDKVRLVAETHEPNSMIRAVAARHGVSESLLFTWRRQARDGLLARAGEAVFMPMRTLAAADMAVASRDTMPRPADPTRPDPLPRPGPLARLATGIIHPRPPARAAVLPGSRRCPNGRVAPGSARFR